MQVSDSGWPTGSRHACPRANGPHEDDVCLRNVVAAVRREKEVLAPAGLHDLEKPRLIDGQRLTVPGIDAALVQVNHSDDDLGALQGDHRHRGACNRRHMSVSTRITSLDTAELTPYSSRCPECQTHTNMPVHTSDIASTDAADPGRLRHLD